MVNTELKSGEKIVDTHAESEDEFFELSIDRDRDTDHNNHLLAPTLVFESGKKFDIGEMVGDRSAGITLKGLSDLMRISGLKIDVSRPDPIPSTPDTKSNVTMLKQGEIADISPKTDKKKSHRRSAA